MKQEQRLLGERSVSAVDVSTVAMMSEKIQISRGFLGFVDEKIDELNYEFKNGIVFDVKNPTIEMNLPDLADDSHYTNDDSFV